MGSREYKAQDISPRDKMVEWRNLGKEAESGEPFGRFRPSDSLTVTFDGIFDGAKVKLQGAINNSFMTLNDTQGNSLSTGSPKIEAVLEKVLEIAPIVENPGSKTNITITVLICGR